MELYHIGLQQAERHMRQQFEDAGDSPPDRPDTPRRHTPTVAARIAIGAALYRLASAIDPATPVPSRQH